MQRNRLSDGIGDLKGMTWRQTGAEIRRRERPAARFTRRQVIGLAVALALAWAFLHVALEVIFATQPVRVDRSK
ncbi:hypothetical protein KDW69_21160 [Burkholderia ambifaria]|uniref:hypothetical protein n=1 Tax=Burkholderia ambifaria TaxID=152480 RepID=UPI001B979FBF|nr:hypothetical protein [Burkholderia ambifaria]MBR8334167.1 hypothetical protein [Burkholderia ambifaria]